MMTAIALLFPGQGSQETGMGRSLAEKHPEVMELWKKAERISGIALREIYWDGDAKQMPLTRNLQPALTVADYGFWMHLSKKISPSCTAGHSLGEYSAMAAAKVLSIETVLELVTLRGQLMSEADPDGKGTMAALLKVSLEQVQDHVTEVAKMTGETLVIANYNTPGQYVVSGTLRAVQAISDAIKEIKGRAIPLSVSGAFHSPLMEEASKELSKALNGLGKGAWSNATFPVYCNATASGETDATLLKKQLCRQMTSSVYWVDTICNQWRDGSHLFVECGPKSVLTNMVGPILKEYAPAASEPPQWKTLAVNNLESVESFSE